MSSRLRRINRARALAGLAGLALVFPALPATAGGFGTGNGSWLPSGMAVGGMAVVTPTYEGAKDYRVTGVPLIQPTGLGQATSGLISFRGADDIRLRVLNSGGFEAGPLAGWRFNRDEDDSNRLLGLGDVDGGFVAGGYAGYRMGGFMPYVSYHRQVSGDDTGGVVRFGLESTMQVAPGVSVLAIAGASYADEDYMRSYFSVTSAQSRTSVAGLSAYAADAGVKDVFFGLSSNIPITADWTLRLSGRYTRLIGDAGDSPIVESENQFSGGIGLTYRFNLGR